MKIKDFSYLYRIKSKLFNKILIFTLYPNSGIIKINNLTKEVLVGAHQKYPGTLTIPISEKDKVGFAFGVRYVKNGSFGALQVIHDIKNDPKKF